MPAANFIDLTGQVFGRLTVIKRVENGPNGGTRWACQCSCGNFVIVTGEHLRRHLTKSCGCLVHEPAVNRTHNETGTRLFKIWCGMRKRCNNSNLEEYNNYGGRGISVCDEWYDYTVFRDWALEHGYQDNLSIDRIDVNGNYCPENCQWATPVQQANNRRNNRMITCFDETHSLADWCKILNLPYKVIESRLSALHWDFWTAISTPLPDHYYEGCYDYDYSNEYYEDPYEYYEDPYEYDNYIYDE